VTLHLEHRLLVGSSTASNRRKTTMGRITSGIGPGRTDHGARHPQYPINKQQTRKGKGKRGGKKEKGKKGKRKKWGIADDVLRDLLTPGQIRT